MADEPTAARTAFGDLAPKLAEITDKVLFGDVWADDTLSPRDRSLVTIVNLAALYRVNELPFHLGKALDNGETPICAAARVKLRSRAIVTKAASSLMPARAITEYSSQLHAGFAL